jgi:hypothetical protein
VLPGRVPLDKEKGFVKGKEILSGAEHRLLPTSESVGPRLWDITAKSLSGGSLHRTIDTTETTIMILLYTDIQPPSLCGSGQTR